MENMDKKTLTNLAIGAVLVIIALVSALWLADVFSAPEHHSASIAALDEKKTTVMEMTAATATASVVISLVPGDSTTPIADQVAQLSSYLLIVTGVVMLEKFLLVITWKAAFKILIPAACVLWALYRFWPKAMLKNLAIRLALFGLALCMVIPVSLKVSRLFEDAFDLKTTVTAAVRDAGELEEEATEEEGAEGETEQGGIGGWFASLGDQISGGVSDAVDEAEAKLSEFIDAVAVLIVSNCVIPVLVLVLMLWLLKAFVSLPLGGGSPRPLALPEHKRRETD